MKAMSKRLVVKALRAQGCVKISEEGPHEKWQCKNGCHTTAVPRSNEVSAGVCRNIIRDLTCLKKGWLQ
jgi:predicted RNA binding protein YcfA (HicA-like mRNA interferase family)